MNALVVGERPLPDAPELIRRYCGLPWSGGAGETWAFRYFDCLGASDPDEVEPIDVLATAALHPGLTHADLAWFWNHRDDLGRLLRRLPAALDLADADATVLEELRTLPRQLAENAPGLALLTKVLHRKRPQLVPMLDRALLDRYRTQLPGRGTESWGALVEAIRRDLAAPDNAEIFSDIRESLAAELEVVPTHLRLLDISVWMHSRRRPER